MAKVSMLCLGLLVIIFPLFSSSPNVRGVTGLFEIAYPFALPAGDAGFSFSMNNVDLKSGDVDANLFYLGMGWGGYHNIEFNVNLSYHRVKRENPFVRNVEYLFAGPSQNGLGYASFALKYNFLKSKNTGLGALAYLDLRLSDEEEGVTGEKNSWGLELLFAHKFSERTIFSLNLGSRFKNYPGNFVVDPGETFRYAAGIEAGIGDNFSVVAQLAGKVYYRTDFIQDNPLDGIVGLKYEHKDKYDNYDFGISVAYKKNLVFHTEKLSDSHGIIGSMWFYIGQYKNPCKLPAAVIKSVRIEGDERVAVGDVNSYNAVTPGGKALTDEYKPILYVWRVSANGRISGQGCPVIDVMWESPSEESWVEVRVSNKCTSVAATKAIIFDPPPSKKKY